LPLDSSCPATAGLIVRFAALEDLDTEVEINTIWETIRESIQISVKESLGNYEQKQYKPWFDEG
jgi:hypothetical protein